MVKSLGSLLLWVKVLWSNEVLDGCSKNPVVSKTKESDSVCCDLINVVTQILTHRQTGDVTT